MTRKKSIAIGIVAVVLIAAAVGGYLLWQNLGAGGSSDGAVYVQSVSDLNSAGYGTANRFSGVIESQETEKVMWDSSKTVLEVLVEEGDVVQQGTPLFTYDTQSMTLELEQGNLEIERQNNTIETDTTKITELEKEKKSAKTTSDKLAYESQIQQLQADVATAEYAIKTKQAELNKLQTEIDNATVTATMAGTVQNVADLQELVENGGIGSDGQQEPLVTILANGDLRVKGKISEQNIYDLSQGMSVIVRSRLDTSITWSGTVSSIDTSQTTEDDNNYYYSSDSNSASNYAFYVALDNADGLMMGQHVTIEPDYGQNQAKSGIWLDAGWIVQDENGNSTVWKKGNNGKLTAQSVELGDYDEDLDQYEIKSGLDNSDYIAWPDEDCKEGAATTQEMVWDDSDTDDFFVEDDSDDMGDLEDISEDISSDEFFSTEEADAEDAEAVPVPEAVG